MSALHLLPPALGQPLPQNTSVTSLTVQQPDLAQTEMAQTLLRQGLEQYEAEQFSLAMVSWAQALETFETQADQLNQALAHSYLSLAYQQLGQWDEAQRAIATSLDLLQSSSSQTLSKHGLEVWARVLNTQGRLQWSNGEFVPALTTWQQATSFYRQVQDLEGVILSSINQARALQGLGLNVRAATELDQLAQLLQQESISPRLQAMGWWHLGNARRQIGEFDQSLENLHRAMAIAHTARLDALRCSILLDLGNTERAIADQSAVINQPEIAQTHYLKAIDHYQQAAQSTSHFLHFQAQINVLSLLTRIGALEQAVSLWPQVMAARTADLSRTQIFASLNFAQSLICLKQLLNEQPPDSHQPSNTPVNTPRCSAVIKVETIQISDELLPSWLEISQLLADAIRDARRLQDLKAESYALGQLGLLYELTGQWKESELLTRRALFIAETLQAPDIRYRWEWQLGRLQQWQGNLLPSRQKTREQVRR